MVVGKVAQRIICRRSVLKSDVFCAFRVLRRLSRIVQRFLSRLRFRSFLDIFTCWSAHISFNVQLSKSLSEGLVRMKNGMHQLNFTRLNRIFLRKNSVFILAKFNAVWRTASIGSASIARKEYPQKAESAGLKDIEPKELNKSAVVFGSLTSPVLMEVENGKETSRAQLSENRSTPNIEVLDTLLSSVRERAKFEMYLVEQASTWLKLAWKQESGLFPQDSVFSLQWRKEDDPMWNSVAESIPVARVRLEHLRPGTRYTFRVRSKHSTSSWSDFGESWTFSTLTLGDQVPGLDPLSHIDSQRRKITSSPPEKDGASSESSQLEQEHTRENSSRWDRMISEILNRARLDDSSQQVSKNNHRTSGIGLRIRFTCARTLMNPHPSKHNKYIICLVL